MAVVQMTPQTGATREKTEFTMFEDYEFIRPGVVRKRFLKFDLNALADFEQEMGMGFMQLMQKQAVFAVGRALLWAGLKHEDRGLSIQRVGELMSRAIKEKKFQLNDFLVTAMAAAAEQGALGEVTDQSANEGPAASADPNDSQAIPAVALPPKSSESPDPGLNGSPEPNPSPTEH